MRHRHRQVCVATGSPETYLLTYLPLNLLTYLPTYLLTYSLTYQRQVKSGGEGYFTLPDFTMIRLHTTHFALPHLHGLLHTSRSTSHASHLTLHTPHNHASHFTLHTSHFALHASRFTGCVETGRRRKPLSRQPSTRGLTKPWRSGRRRQPWRWRSSVRPH